MASIGFPKHAKTVTLPSGTTYAWVSIRPQEASKPTILFLHGFPSSSYDWRHQINYFAPRGYGILAPDLLGYGGTDKPEAVEAYNFKAMAADIIAILDHEGLERVHGVGHDFGSPLLSRIINYFPSRIISASFLVVPYSPPGEAFDLDAAKTLTEAVLGFERLGYFRFMIEPDSWKVIDAHVSERFRPSRTASNTNHQRLIVISTA